jgi:protein-tyrosine phosphatase
MIDIHTHIIPDLDDGPPDMETSVSMGRIAAEEGIEAIISTSHSEEAAKIGRQAMEARLDAVRKAWGAAGLNVNLHLGVEIFMWPDTAATLKSGELWTLAESRYILVEIQYQPWPPYADQTLFDLQLAGYTPILAHPERYVPIQNDPNRMCALVERGVLAQVTSDALLGGHGPAAKKCAETLVRHNLAQFLSSDAHGVTGRKRMPRLHEALKVAEGLVGEEAAQALVRENPAHILANTPFAVTPERVTGRKWSLSSLFRS